MSGFKIITRQGTEIRFSCYQDEAPETVSAFLQTLPFSREFFHARVSGEEIWTDDGPRIDVRQENASVFTTAGEVVIGPAMPKRVKTTGCVGIYYGEGRGLDAANIFARVMEEDMLLLQQLGEEIWKGGVQMLRFEDL